MDLKLQQFPPHLNFQPCYIARMFCSTCARRLQLLGRWSTPHQYNAGSLVSRRTFHGTSPTRQNEHSTKPRHPRTWFLDPEPSSLPSSPSSSSPSSSSSQHGSKRQPRPRFTTFDPSSTTPDLPSQPLTPLHPQAESSPFLRGLYDHLTTLEDLVPESIVFLHTPTSRKVLSSSASMGGGGEMIPNTGSTRWDWIVVAQVRGRGKGVIGRAERSLRGWVSGPFHVAFLVVHCAHEGGVEDRMDYG